MKNSKASAQSHLDELQSLVGEAQSMMSSTVGEPSAELLSSLRQRFEDAQERFSVAYADARKKVIAGAKYTDKTIRSNPYQSIAVAAVLGLGVGYLLGRRSSEEQE